MAVTLRNYRGPEDLRLQQTFWVEATRQLPWCWKPTVSPVVYSKGPQFDPRSRCFAFEGDRLVGYCSFTGQAEFVSFGYPWVLPGYEGELQERLYDVVYRFAASEEYGGRMFAQRFRQQWTAQISFFERHGFSVQRSDPVYALDLRVVQAEHVRTACVLTRPAEFHWEDFRALAEQRLSPEQLNMSRQHFETVDFDFAIEVQAEGLPVAYLGLAIRGDTGFAEIIAAVLEPSVDALRSSLVATIAELQTRKAIYLGTKPLPLTGSDALVAEFGFEKVTEELLLIKAV